MHTVLMHCTRTLYSYTVLMRCTHTLYSYIVLIHVLIKRTLYTMH
jgi:hypothetical protein